MELLDRYLQAVKKHLPWERQDDIIAELRANLEAQLEDKEAELGRPLTKEEAEEWLKQIGLADPGGCALPAAAVFDRAGDFPDVLLRPEAGADVGDGDLRNRKVPWLLRRRDRVGRPFCGHALRLPEIWLINAAIVTLIFAVIELTGARFPEKFRALGPHGRTSTASWSPLDLPPVGAGDGDWPKPRSFTRALLEVFSGCLFLAYVLLVPHYPYLLFGPGEWYLRSLPYQLAPVWWTFLLVLVGMNAFELSWKIVDLARGAWQRPPNRARHLAMHALSLIPLSVLLAAPNHALFLLKNPADAAVHGAALASANKGILQALTIVVAIVVLQLVWGIVRASLEAYRNRVAA